MIDLNKVCESPGRFRLTNAPQGADARLLCALARDRQDSLLVVATDEARMDAISQAIGFFQPELEVVQFPPWDCLPYDRVSPNGEVVAARLDALTRLLDRRSRPAFVVTSVSAALQRVPARSAFRGRVLAGRAGSAVATDQVIKFLEGNGYHRAETVMEPGEYALRGGILDLYSTGALTPLRLDYFGDTIESIRAFDPVSQRTLEKRDSFVIKPVSEVVFDDQTIARFRTGYRAISGRIEEGDLLYEAISAGRRYGGFEHWLPLFHRQMETIFDYVDPCCVVLDHQTEAAIDARREQIFDYFQARLEARKMDGMGPPYNPVPPDQLYIGQADWETLQAAHPVLQLSPYQDPDGARVIDGKSKQGRDFAEIRAIPERNLFDALAEHLSRLVGQGKRVLLSAASDGARTRLAHVMAEHGLQNCHRIDDWKEAGNLDESAIGLVVTGFERGFEMPDLALISEQDLLGERLVRPSKKRRVRAENFLVEASSLSEGDLVVHVDHGIGRYERLQCIDVAGAEHDCLKVVYAGGDRLFVPVENIEMLSRYGGETAGIQLDRLGSANWQGRKARLKKRVKEMADALIKVAATRSLKSAAQLTPPEGLYDEFCAKFPFEETEDQLKAVADTLDDLSTGRPMDRLICGDVGFGKTEVALRAAFTAVLAGKQVAVIVPTTLLCRQHFLTFAARFADLPVEIRQISRLVGAKRAKQTKIDLGEGRVDIVIGTHALLAKDVAFADLGLLVIDEEQHFGVRHKERLKRLKSDVHVLTLTATPIPRTLQLALSGVRALSLIATPPVDRLAVRTFITPEDPVVLREAILREHFRSGQVFYVCPRVEDLAKQADRLAKLVPEIKLAVAHGQMTARTLEETMGAFTERRYELLLCTNIIESGLDLPAVNTIIIHRADMFGLAQLYQLRGRVGRSKRRAYAYLTLPPGRVLSDGARKRLDVMQTLDTLGAGFTLASRDLDIRGAGNLLGSEQSGHIREVGIELYQKLLEEAVAEAKGLDEEQTSEWSPQINIGIPVLLPTGYVSDLGVRLGLYRRLGRLGDNSDVDAFAAELVDRFGPLPQEAENLLQTVIVKRLCREAHVAKLDAGPKGAMISFRHDFFPNPSGLVVFISDQAGTVKLRPDHKLSLRRAWDNPTARLTGVKRLMKALAGLASEVSEAS